jgi:Cu(I)/Ag(I) efflux system periplasmic protein CusF
MLATTDENLKHAEQMKKFPDMEHDDPNGKRLSSEQDGRIAVALHQNRHLRIRLPDPGAPRGRHDRHHRRQVKYGKERTMNRTVVYATLFAAMAAAGTALADSHLVKGTVTKVDTAAQKMTIRHGPMKKFDMYDGMTMVFRVKDPAMLKQVKPGDDIRFDADRIEGAFTVIELEKDK